jgi:predicted DNA-binding transcriptional regulator AlpA
MRIARTSSVWHALLFGVYPATGFAPTTGDLTMATASQAPIDPILLRKRQVAAMLQLSERGLDPLVKAGLLPIRRIGPRCVRFLRADVEACAQKLTGDGPTQG